MNIPLSSSITPSYSTLVADQPQGSAEGAESINMGFCARPALSSLGPEGRGGAMGPFCQEAQCPLSVTCRERGSRDASQFSVR